MTSFTITDVLSMYNEATEQITFFEGKLRELRASLDYARAYIPFNYPISMVLSGLLHIRGSYVSLIDHQLMDK